MPLKSVNSKYDIQVESIYIFSIYLYLFLVFIYCDKFYALYDMLLIDYICFELNVFILVGCAFPY
jgi:hypothetical protein